MVKKHVKIISLNYFKVLVGVVLFGIVFCALMLPAAMSAYAANASQKIVSAQKAEDLQSSDLEKSDSDITSDSALEETENEGTANKECNFKVVADASAAWHVLIDGSEMHEDNHYVVFYANVINGNSDYAAEYSISVVPNRQTGPKPLTYITRNEQDPEANLLPLLLYCEITNNVTNEVVGTLYPNSNMTSELNYLYVDSGNYTITIKADKNCIPIYLNGSNYSGDCKFDYGNSEYYWSNNESMLQPWKWAGDLSGHPGARDKYSYLIKKDAVSSISIEEIVAPVQNWQYNPWKKTVQPGGLNMVISFKNCKGEIVGQILRNWNLPSWITSDDKYDFHWQAKIYTLSNWRGICSGLIENGYNWGTNTPPAIQIDSSVSLTNNIWIDTNDDSLGSVKVSHNIGKNEEYGYVDASTSENGVNAILTRSNNSIDQSFFLSSMLANLTEPEIEGANLLWKIKWEDDGTVSINPDPSRDTMLPPQSAETYKLSASGNWRGKFVGWSLFTQNGDDQSYATQDDPRGEKIDYTKPIEFSVGKELTISGNTKIVANFDKVSTAFVTQNENHSNFSMSCYEVYNGFPLLVDYQFGYFMNYNFNPDGYLQVDDSGNLHYYLWPNFANNDSANNAGYTYYHTVIEAHPQEGYEVDSWYLNGMKMEPNMIYPIYWYVFGEEPYLFISVDYKKQVGPVPPIPPDPPVPPGPVPPEPVPPEPVPPQPVPPTPINPDNPGGNVPATGDSTLGIVMLSMFVVAGACYVLARKRKSYTK